jgi:hypothetical protein
VGGGRFVCSGCGGIQLDFQQGIGSLLHLAQCTTWDIVLAVGALPGNVRRCVPPGTCRQCAGSTAGRRISFGGSEQLLCFRCDPNFATFHSHLLQHSGAGDNNVQRSPLVEQQEAASYCSFNNGCGVPGVWVRGEVGPFIHQGARGDGPSFLGLPP